MDIYEHCPTCGCPVTVVAGDEGTSHYEIDVVDGATAQRFKDERNIAREQLRGAVEEVERLRRWIKVDGERQNSERVVAQELERSERDFPHRERCAAPPRKEQT